MNPKQIGIGLVALAVIAVAVMQFGNMNKKQTTTQNTQVTVTQSQATAPAEKKMPSASDSAMATEYKNGQYEAVGHYVSPAQEEEIDISITLTDGVVTDATFTGKTKNQISQKLQGQFAEGFKEQVLGKPINEIALTVVNGSSLTPKGFMDALEKVKEQAKS